jgi:DMSO/TMAO reductase YedYZ molybdopterin-dependent catalytic subunit
MSGVEAGGRPGGNAGKRLAALLFLAGCLLIAAAALLYARPWQGDSPGGDPDWRLTLVGRSGDQRALTLQELKDLPASEGTGGFFTTTGQIRGPFEVKGVGLEDLCGLVGGLGESDLVFVSAGDGYSSVFDHDQVAGRLPAYDPSTMDEVPHAELRLTLMYQQDGKPLSHDDGEPLRLAIIGTERLLTEGFYWVRWVDRIEVIGSG